MCMDKGYDFDEVRILLRQFHFVPHIRSGGEEVQCMKKSPRWRARRWVVERTHSWMNRFRDILTCWTKKPENFLAQLHLACAYITLGQCGEATAILKRKSAGRKIGSIFTFRVLLHNRDLVCSEKPYASLFRISSD